MTTYTLRCTAPYPDDIVFDGMPEPRIFQDREVAEWVAEDFNAHPPLPELAGAYTVIEIEQ